VTAAGLVQPTLRVRNAFGVERQNSARLLLPEVSERPAVEVVGMATGVAPALRGGANANANAEGQP
jgi:hypothetical protein